MIHGVPVKTYNALQNHIIVLLFFYYNLPFAIFQKEVVEKWSLNMDFNSVMN